jgi:hypothetical protein
MDNKVGAVEADNPICGTWARNQLFHLLADAALLLLDFAGAAIGLLDGVFLQRQSGGAGEKLIVRVAAA